MRRSLWMAAAAMAIFGVAGPALAQRNNDRIENAIDRARTRELANLGDIAQLRSEFQSRLLLEQTELRTGDLQLRREIAQLQGNRNLVQRLDDQIRNIERSARDRAADIRDQGRNFDRNISDRSRNNRNNRNNGRFSRFDGNFGRDLFGRGDLGFDRDLIGFGGFGGRSSFGRSFGSLDRDVFGFGSRSGFGRSFSSFDRDLFGGRGNFGRSFSGRDFDRGFSLRIGGDRFDQRSVRSISRFSRFDGLGSSRFNRRASNRDLRFGSRFDSRSFDSRSFDSRGFDRLSERELRDLLRNDRAFGRNGLSRSLGLSGFGNSRFGGSRFSTAFFDRSDFFGRSARSNFRDVGFIRDVRSADRFAAREISRFADDLGGFVGGNRGRQIERQLDRTANRVRNGQR